MRASTHMHARAHEFIQVPLLCVKILARFKIGQFGFLILNYLYYFWFQVILQNNSKVDIKTNRILTDNPKINTTVYGQVIFNKSPKLFNGERTGSPINGEENIHS